MPEPPTNWDDFMSAIEKSTKYNQNGDIIQSGVALGGSKNVSRYSDILSVLMMQSGAVMMDDAGQIVFNRVSDTIKQQQTVPGVEALRFYTDFASPAKEVYSWNKDLNDSLTMFTQGKLGMFFGYSYQLPQIRSLAPKLNFGIAKLPQIEGNPQSINFANYWMETVSSKSKNADIAWDFVQFATRPEQAKLYLDATKRPTALRSLINSQLDDENISVFAEQALTAKSWYKGVNANAMEAIIGEMIDSVVAGQNKIEDIINLGAQKIQQTINN